MFASRGLQSLVTKYELRSSESAETQKKDAAEIYKGRRKVVDIEMAHAQAEPPKQDDKNTHQHKSAW